METKFLHVQPDYISHAGLAWVCLRSELTISSSKCTRAYTPLIPRKLAALHIYDPIRFQQPWKSLEARLNSHDSHKNDMADMFSDSRSPLSP